LNLVSIYKEVKTRLNGEDRPLIDDVLKSIQESSKPFLYIVRAPTGYGKTVISISCSIYSVFDSSLFPKVVHILPMRSIVEDVQYRASKILDEAVKSKMMDVKEDELEVFHSFPLNITTVDTFTWDIMKLNTRKIKLIREEKEFGYDFLTQGSLLDSLLFFDEAHYILEDENMKTVFSIVLELILRYKTSLIISTATLSKGYEEYFAWLAQAHGYEFNIFEPDSLDPFIKKEREKQFDIHLVDNKGDILPKIKNCINLDKVNLIVVNSPYTAVRVYDEITALGEAQTFLLHGNMKKTHRKQVLEEVRKVFKNKNPSVIITTQVIEAGVDISSNILITEVSVAQSLLQRMGRVARYDENSADIYILKSKGEPYPSDKIEKTWTWLKRNSSSLHPRIPSLYYQWLNEVHGKNMEQINPKYSLSNSPLLKELSIKLLDLYTRSPEILRQIEKILTHRPFLREFTIPIKVDDEYILFSPIEVKKMFQDKSIEVKINGECINAIPDFSKILEIAKVIALGVKAVEVNYQKVYDNVRGIIP